MPLGIRTSFKEDLQTSSAALVYGETLRLPGEFFESSEGGTTDLTEFSARLKNIAEKLRPMPASRHAKPKVFIYKELATTEYVFLREDALRGALQPAYSGPYKVLTRGDKTFKLHIKGKEITVSIDRIKPAFVLSEQSEEPLPNIQKDYVTRSGRKVKFTRLDHP